MGFQHPHHRFCTVHFIGHDITYLIAQKGRGLWIFKIVYRIKYKSEDKFLAPMNTPSYDSQRTTSRWSVMGKQESSVDRAYVTLREMAVNFEFKPDERLNESALSAQLGASRTPLREALNRLVAEGFLTFKNGRGFFCRSLSPARILELYEARAAIETECLRRSIDRASDDEINALIAELDQSETTYETCTDMHQLLRMDEDFHMRLAELSNNSEMLQMLTTLNDKIRYVRLVNLQQLRSQGDDAPRSRLSAHRTIMNALRDRDCDAAITALRNHIERRGDETTEAVRIAYSQLYVPNF